MDGCVLLTSTPSCVVSPRGDPSGCALGIARRGETTHSGVDVNNTHPSMINPLISPQQSWTSINPLHDQAWSPINIINHHSMMNIITIIIIIAKIMTNVAINLSSSMVTSCHNYSIINQSIVTQNHHQGKSWTNQSLSSSTTTIIQITIVNQIIMAIT